MKVTVISYSMTGNNDKLAEKVAKELDATHIRIRDPKKRTNATIAMDMMFNRTPGFRGSVNEVDTDGLIIFFGPVWMGKVASPLRGPIKELGKRMRRYAFIALSGGSDGPNKKIGRELKKRAGGEPEFFMDLHITDLFESEPTRQEISDFDLDDENAQKLANRIINRIEKISE